METISLLLFLTQLIQWSHSLMLLILIPVFISGGQKGKKNTKVVGQAPRENKKLGAASTRKDITWGVVHGPMQILRVMKKFHGIFHVL